MSEPASHDFIVEGDVVEHKMNPLVFGIVIGMSGSLVHIRTSPALATLTFHEWELRPVQDDAPPPSKEEDPPAEAAGNVVFVDFTKQQDLSRAKPAGRA